jgi:hypothetical protein
MDREILFAGFFGSELFVLPLGPKKEKRKKKKKKKRKKQ